MNSYEWNENSLRRTVWVGKEIREEIMTSAEKALKSKDPYKNDVQFKKLLVEVAKTSEICKGSTPHSLPYEVRVVKVLLNLPDDSLPLTITDEEVNSLVIWGDLNEGAVNALTPEPKIFITPDSPLFYYDDENRCRKCEISEKYYNKLRNNYQRRLPLTTISLLKGLAKELKKISPKDEGVLEDFYRKTEKNPPL